MDTNENIFDWQEYIILNTDNVSFPSTSAACDLLPSTSGTASGTAATRKLDHKWTQNETKILIDLYGKLKNKVGTFQIKNIKMLWEKIANELAKLHIIVTPNNCLNRWKVLERNFKKFVDNQNKTGRGRKYFEYEAEMSEIFGKKKI
ncbi:unnamed protein product [Ceutorhynchus assimilis]|uniref:Myb-like domain-containing protein n=1 Tax=Ceutorhynchus assimilis TaxID=467358 RepID=A0A9P0GXV5_9CUCU|nr:unnamed protein product [Ceutorhynchus assimilis]